MAKYGQVTFSEKTWPFPSILVSYFKGLHVHKLKSAQKNIQGNTHSSIPRTRGHDIHNHIQTRIFTEMFQDIFKLMRNV